MPLVVPDVTTNSADKTEQWMRKLVGKKLGDEGSSETVRFFPLLFPFNPPPLLPARPSKERRLKGETKANGGWDAAGFL